MADVEERSSTVKGSNFEGCLLNSMEILVKDIEKRAGEKLKEPYIVYLIETRSFNPEPDSENQSTSLWRRYSEFDMLRNYLQTTYPGLIIPPLPEKKVMCCALSFGNKNNPPIAVCGTTGNEELSHFLEVFQIFKTNLAAFRMNSENYNMAFVERRRGGLEYFLHRIAKHPKLGLDELFKSFLTQDDGWKESVIATNYQSKADSKLKSLSASFNVKNADTKYEDIKNYAQTLQGNIASLLKVQQKISEKHFNIHKEHANYGRIFSEWSSIEDEMGDSLQKAGHYMDNLAASIDDIQEEEECQYVDRLKEYHLYADAIRVMTKKQQLLQSELEKADETLASRVAQKDDLVKAGEDGEEGKKTGGLWKGFSSKIFGGDTPEAREAKLTSLETQIEEGESAVQTANEELSSFTEIAEEDYKMFEKQRNRDVTNILVGHIKSQIKMCKHGMLTWENMKDTFQAMS